MELTPRGDAVAFPRWFQRMSGLRGVILIYVAYGVIHSAISLLGDPAIAHDDVKLNVVAQSWRWGYLLENPPLYEWLLRSVQSIFGPGLLSFLIVKYALMIITGAFVYLAAEQMMNDREWATVSALSLVTSFQIGWGFHEAFTHTLALIACSAAFFYALAVLLRAGDWRAYALLGVASGLGLIAKYSFVGVLICGVVALAVRRESRRRLASGKIFLTMAIIGVIIAPHVHWLVTANASVAAAATERLQGAAPHWLRAAQGGPASLWAMGSFFLPFALIIGAVFGVRWRFSNPDDEVAFAYRDMFFAGAAGIMGATILLGIPSLQERYAIAFMAPALLWIVAKLKMSAPSPRRLSIFLASIVAVAAVFAVVRIVQVALPGAPFCSSCRQWVPHDALARAIEEEGFVDGTLVAFTDHTAGNLRRNFPSARVVSAHLPFYTPPNRNADQTCFFIWSTDLGPPPPQSLLQKIDPKATVRVDAEWAHFARPRGWRRTTWMVADLEGAPSVKSALCKLE